MLGTVPSSLVFCGGLESTIQTAGLNEKAEQAAASWLESAELGLENTSLLCA